MEGAGRPPARPGRGSVASGWDSRKRVVFCAISGKILLLYFSKMESDLCLFQPRCEWTQQLEDWVIWASPCVLRTVVCSVMEASAKYTGCCSQEGPPAGLPEDLGCISKPCVCISLGGQWGAWVLGQRNTAHRAMEDPVARENTCDLRWPRGGPGRPCRLSSPQSGTL